MIELTRPLRPGDKIRPLFSKEEFIIKYVNASGAYAVPVKGLVREIKARIRGKQGTQTREVEFTAPGRMLSDNSLVELIGCVEVEGDGRMAGVKGKNKGKATAKGKPAASKVPKEDKVARKGTTKKPEPAAPPEPEEAQVIVIVPELTDVVGATFDDFEAVAVVEGATFGEFATESEQVAGQAGEGHAAETESGTPNSNSEGDEMAKKANGKAAAKGKVKKAKAPQKLRSCACGCGGETTSYFMPGHDARLHGWVKKLADGRIDGSGKDAKSGERVIPSSVIKAFDLVATKEGHRAKNPHFYQDAD